VHSSGERCPARIELSDFQIHWLKRRPYGSHQVRRHHECQLEYGHDGPHGAAGQTDDEVEWWIRWTLTASAVEQVLACSGFCDASEDPDDEATCLLFEGHPGRHSFELTY
jgi:hypothetical protein